MCIPGARLMKMRVFLLWLGRGSAFPPAVSAAGAQTTPTAPLPPALVFPRVARASRPEGGFLKSGVSTERGSTETLFLHTLKQRMCPSEVPVCPVGRRFRGFPESLWGLE